MIMAGSICVGEALAACNRDDSAGDLVGDSVEDSAEDSAGDSAGDLADVPAIVNDT